jgi:hypothetical protein
MMDLEEQSLFLYVYAYLYIYDGLGRQSLIYDGLGRQSLFLFLLLSFVIVLEIRAPRHVCVAFFYLWCPQFVRVHD